MEIRDLKVLFLRKKITSEVLDSISILTFSDKLDPAEYCILSLFIAHRTLKGANDETFKEIISSNVLNSFYDHLAQSLLFISIKRLPSGYLVINPDRNKEFDFLKKVPLEIALRSFGAPYEDIKYFIHLRKKGEEK